MVRRAGAAPSVPTGPAPASPLPLDDLRAWAGLRSAAQTTERGAGSSERRWALGHRLGLAAGVELGVGRLIAYQV